MEIFLNPQHKILNIFFLSDLLLRSQIKTDIIIVQK